MHFFKNFIKNISCLLSIFLLIFFTLPAHSFVSDNDKRTLILIDNYIRRDDFSKVLELKNSLENTEIQNYIYWKYLINSNTVPTYQEIDKFMQSNPRMPYQNILQKKLENTLSDTNFTEQQQFFSKYKPISTQGRLIEIEYLLKKNYITIAKQKLKKLWHYTPLTEEHQKKVLSKYGKYLTKKDHSIRIRHLIDDRKYQAAKDLLGVAYTNDRVRYDLRRKLHALDRKAPSIYSRSPKTVKQDPGVLRSLVYYYRKTDQDSKAIETIKRLTKKQSNEHPKEWYTSRKILARVAFKNGQRKNAYQIISQHGLSEGGDYVDAEFYAGWLALRQLGSPKTALKHFQNGRKKSSMPISVSRFEYWIGRACAALNDKPCSKIAYNNASRYFYTFYGQLAAYHAGTKQINIKYNYKKSDIVRKIFFQDSLIQAAHAAHIMNNQGDVRLLLTSLAKRQYKDPYVYALLEEITKELGDLKTQVKLGKYASYNNNFLLDAGYPIIKTKLSSQAPEIALVHALTRQESEFDQHAVSGANAYGLMQLLPNTAKGVARKLGEPYKKSYLTSKPEYNMLLGSTYLGGLVDQFNGSYIHALSGYNAGPSRVYQWDESYGKLTPDLYQIIDRIEMIPFSETRNYVQRILETVQIYRAKFSGQSSINPANLVKDLRRGI